MMALSVFVRDRGRGRDFIPIPIPIPISIHFNSIHLIASHLVLAPRFLLLASCSPHFHFISSHFVSIHRREHGWQQGRPPPPTRWTQCWTQDEHTHTHRYCCSCSRARRHRPDLVDRATTAGHLTDRLARNFPSVQRARLADHRHCQTT